MPEPGFNEDGIPTCPNDSTLPMKFDRITRGKNRADRIKWLCPKSKKLELMEKLNIFYLVIIHVLHR